MMSETLPAVIYVMGVSGCGKSTVGVLLAEAVGGVFLDGDDFHPPGNKQKMGAGLPLEDEDRWPWFDLIKEEIARVRPAFPVVVVACSSLKRAHRERLCEGVDGAKFVYLKGSQDLVGERLRDRVHEYMPSSLLDSQFAALEEPTPEEEVLAISIEPGPEEMVAQIRQQLAS